MSNSDALEQAERDVYSEVEKILGRDEFNRIYEDAVLRTVRELVLNGLSVDAYGGVCSEVFHIVMLSLPDARLPYRGNNLPLRKLTELYRKYVDEFTKERHSKLRSTQHKRDGPDGYRNHRL